MAKEAIKITLQDSEKPGCIGITFMKTNDGARQLAKIIQGKSVGSELDVRRNIFLAHITSEDLVDILHETEVATIPPRDEIIAAIEERNTARDVYR